MNHYEAKQAARKERLERRAAKVREQADQKYQEGRRRLEAIPFGQPILVGHHSEKRDRAYRSKAVGKIDKAFQLFDKADHYERAAERVGSGGISSDDPDAIAKLEKKLAGVEAGREHMKRENAEARKAGKPAPFPAYSFTNTGGNIRSIKQRIERLKKAQERPAAPDIVFAGGILRQNKEENRIQFIFEGKPDEKVRTILKGRGFRWSPLASAWQRKLTGNGLYSAKYALQEIKSLNT